MSMQTDLEKVVGRKVVSVKVHMSYDGLESSFTMTFDDGTELSVSGRGFSDGSAVVEADVS